MPLLLAYARSASSFHADKMVGGYAVGMGLSTDPAANRTKWLLTAPCEGSTAAPDKFCALVSIDSVVWNII